MLLPALALVWTLSADVTAGWEDVASTRLYPETTKVSWSADFALGEGAFVVERHAGAEGRVSFTPHGIYIAKTNETGFLVVRPKVALQLPVGQTFRVYADVSEVTGDVSYSQAYLRLIGPDRRFFAPERGDLNCDAGGGPRATSAVNTPPQGSIRKYGSGFTYGADYRGVKKGGVAGGCVWPVIVVAGAPSSGCWKNWKIVDFDADKNAWGRYCEELRNKGSRTRDYSQDLQSASEFAAALAADCDHTAKIVTQHGYARLLVDGQEVPAIPYKDVGRAKVFCGRRFASAGVNINTVTVPFGRRLDLPANLFSWTPQGFDVHHAADRVRDYMRRSPHALFILSMPVNPYPEFAQEHPEEIWRDGKGGVVYGQDCHVSFLPNAASDPRCWPWISMYSLVWRTAAKKALTSFIDELKRQGLSKRIIGVHISGFHDGQFAPVKEDFSPPARAAFARWLERRYGSPEKLAAAWKTARVPFGEVLPPSWTDFGTYYTGKDFFDPATDRRLIDYQLFLHDAPFEPQEDLAHCAKMAFGKPIVAMKWCMGAFGGSAHASYDFTRFCQSDAIDILIAQAAYANRPPAMPLPEFRVWSSMHAHNKLYMDELDFPTYRTGYGATAPHAMGRGMVEDYPHWQSMHAKHVGQMFAHRTGYWYYDMSGAAYDDDRQLEDVAFAVQTARQLIAAGTHPWVPSAAVIVDEEGMLHRNLARYMSDEPLTVRGQCTLLAQSGVPYDMFLADDLLRRPDLGLRYRVLVFLGFNHLDSSRQSLLAHLSSQGRTLIFVGGSGHLGGAVEGTGFSLHTDARNLKGHDIVPVPGVAAAEVRSLIASAERLAVGETNGWHFCHHRPIRFSVQESPDVNVWGRYAEDGAIAVAEKRQQESRNVMVCDVAGLTPALFNRLVREADGYVPLPPGVAQVEMNGDFVCVHALANGTWSFHLPFAANVKNLKSGIHEAVNGQDFTMSLTAGETCWFGLSKK